MTKAARSRRIRCRECLILSKTYLEDLTYPKPTMVSIRTLSKRSFRTKTFSKILKKSRYNVSAFCQPLWPPLGGIKGLRNLVQFPRAPVKNQKIDFFHFLQTFSKIWDGRKASKTDLVPWLKPLFHTPIDFSQNPIFSPFQILQNSFTESLY